MLIGLIANAGDRIALFIKGRIFVDEIAITLIIAMQIRNIGGNLRSLGIMPGPITNAIARIDGWLTIGSLCAQISMPGAITGSSCAGKRLANGISASLSAQITTGLGSAGAGAAGAGAAGCWANALDVRQIKAQAIRLCFNISSSLIV
jgi:hypothetical protein